MSKVLDQIVPSEFFLFIKPEGVGTLVPGAEMIEKRAGMPLGDYQDLNETDTWKKPV